MDRVVFVCEKEYAGVCECERGSVCVCDKVCVCHGGCNFPPAVGFAERPSAAH